MTFSLGEMIITTTAAFLLGIFANYLFERFLIWRDRRESARRCILVCGPTCTNR